MSVSKKNGTIATEMAAILKYKYNFKMLRLFFVAFTNQFETSQLIVKKPIQKGF